MTAHTATTGAHDWQALAGRIRGWARELGFDRVGITDTELDAAERELHQWLAEGRHGRMQWMAAHGDKRTRPAELLPGTLRIVSVGMDYWPAEGADARAVLRDGRRAYVARYALGRDYHKVLRRRLQRLADRVAAEIGPFGYRAFTDSAPVMEKPLAHKAGLGTPGKNTCLIDGRSGSYFFLGELYTDLPLPVDAPREPDVCGSCRACINVCPTGAITGPYRIDARRCISYLTIENDGPIPESLRPLMGNRVFGCDDCQVFCPWNRHATTATERDFRVRNGLDAPDLVALFRWSEAEFLAATEGSAIRRISHECWLRNVAVALGNAPTSAPVVAALRERAGHPSPLVREHVAWALARHGGA
ncbi:MAG: tRNA epoxyqueuosine(34) reductase QueG [Halofilum sp. (in: g-proteobacteria)]|nr:tRNA epoxyqueuosine(34) reductase QueG [Halofilum sp. (in: g-proteobacteria)]